MKTVDLACMQARSTDAEWIQNAHVHALAHKTNGTLADRV